MKSINIDDIKLTKKLGSGMFGTTYLGLYKNKKYAVKIEKISEKDLEYNLVCRDWRDIEFSENFANGYPEQFIYLYKYDLINNCKHIQEYATGEIPKHLPEEVIKKLEEKQKSNYCIRKVYSLLDTTFSNIYDELTKEQFYSFIGQIAYIHLLLKQNNYTHNDFHGQNAGILFVKKDKKLDILNYNFPTFGIQCKAIDYGMVLNNKYKMNQNEKKIHKQYKTEEIDRLIRRLIYFEDNKNFNKLITSDKDINLLNETKKHFLFKSTKDLCKDIKNRFLIFQILYPEEFQKIFLKDKFENTSYPKCKIDLVDFIYILNNNSNSKNIINLCYNKLINK
jgi:hypothetical protein